MRSLRSVLIAIPTALAVILTGVPLSASAAARTASVASVVIPAAPEATVFRAPLTSAYTVVSAYGPRCIPLQGASTYHLGVDMAAPSGTPIYAVSDGVITATVDGSSSQAGYVDVRFRIGADEYFARSYHIWKSTTRVKVGQLVKAGQRISEVGSSGVSGGPHLHLEIWKATKGGNVSSDPRAFLKSRGVDLYGDAKAVSIGKLPATCTYYTAGTVNFRTGPSTSYSIIRVLPKGTSMTHVPGRITTAFLPVTIDGVSGWVSWPLVTPNKPAPTPAPASLGAKTVTYKTKIALNLRASASMKGRIILVLPKSANIGAIKATSGVWRKVTYKGKTGWVHSAYIKKR